MAMFGAGSMLLAGTLAALPGAAGAQGPEEKTLLVQESFTGASLDDPAFQSLNVCLTANTVVGDEDEFDSCSDEAEGPTPASGKDPGYLQLTDAALYDYGGMVYNKPLENKGGIEITFAQYQYGGTGADGISFFLVEGDTDLTQVGAYGGSLGYAQFDRANVQRHGVDGGYLGLGLDAWGNFSADTEGRGRGCPEQYRAPEYLREWGDRAPDNVALRGPGQGLDGYCLLATTAIDEQIGSDHDGDIYGTDFPEKLNTDTLEEAKRLVKLKVSDDEHPTVTVDIDFQDGNGWKRVLESQVPFKAPETFKFGFAASSGYATNVHLIRHLRVETFE
ncbi:lectin-like domain-containing protein [Glycomyces endophyticus]